MSEVNFGNVDMSRLHAAQSSLDLSRVSQIWALQMLMGCFYFNCVVYLENLLLVCFYNARIQILWSLFLAERPHEWLDFWGVTWGHKVLFQGCACVCMCIQCIYSCKHNRTIRHSLSNNDALEQRSEVLYSNSSTVAHSRGQEVCIQGLCLFSQ